MNDADIEALANVLAAVKGRAAPYPNLRLEDLSPKVQDLFRTDLEILLRQRNRRGSALTDAEVYRAALAHFGLRCPVCPAPLPSRAVTCRMCGSMIVRDPASALAAPQPGRRLEDLSPEEQARFDEHVKALLEARTELTDREVYRMALAHFGVRCPACPAPPPSGEVICGMCGAIVPARTNEADR